MPKIKETRTQTKYYNLLLMAHETYEEWLKTHPLPPQMDAKHFRIAFRQGFLYGYSEKRKVNPLERVPENLDSVINQDELPRS